MTFSSGGTDSDKPSESPERQIVDAFHRLYYENKEQTWRQTFWLGAPVQKCPFDLWIYQEILHSIQPGLIVECGTFDGGSALFLATICDLLGKGEIITIDAEPRPGRPDHARITYFTGSSISQDIVTTVKQAAEDRQPVLVILDSDHRKDHVLEELRVYSEIVTLGSYLIVEDSNINGWPVLPEFGPGPMEALNDFLKATDRFVSDERWEKFYLTFNPRGFLKRLR